MDIEPEKEKGTPMDVEPGKKHTFMCKQCLFRSQSKEEFEEHIRTSHGIQCDICKQEFKEVKNLNKHMKNVHKEKNLKCTMCSYITNDPFNMQRHTESCIKQIDKALERARKLELPHPLKENVPKPQHDEPQHDGIQQDGSREKTAFKRRLKDREWLIRGHSDPLTLLNTYKNRIKGALLLALKKEGPQKIELFLKVNYYKEDKDGNKTEHSAYHNGLLVLLFTAHVCILSN